MWAGEGHRVGIFKVGQSRAETELNLRGENFRGQVSDVRRDLPPSQELCHFVAEGVTVVFKEVIGFTSVHYKKDLETGEKAKKLLKPGSGKVSTAEGEDCEGLSCQGLCLLPHWTLTTKL